MRSVSTLSPLLLLCPVKVELPLHVERLVQSVKALCSSLAAVETPDVTSALNQLPACPCRLQPKVLKVKAFRLLLKRQKLGLKVLMCHCSLMISSHLSSQDASVLAVRENRGTNQCKQGNLLKCSLVPLFVCR